MTLQTDAISKLPRQWRDELATYWSDDGPRFRHIAKVAMAMTLAMGICMRLELRTPATAMVSCVIVMMHQQSGMVIARGFYRGLGMVCGSLAGLLLITFFPQQPLLFMVMLAAWIGLCVFGASYYRNFQSYGFVLTGYGTAITAIPVWSNPYGVFDNVVFTVSEVVIGVVCASVVSAVVFPQPVSPALYATSRRNFSNLLNTMRQMLGDARSVAGFDTFLDLIREQAGMETLRSGAVFEDPSIRLHNHVFLEIDHSFLDTVAWIHALHQLKARVTVEADPRALEAVDEMIAGLLSIVPNETQLVTITLQQVEDLSCRLAVFERDLPLCLGRLLSSLADLEAHQRQFVATTGSALLLSVTDLRRMCSSYVAARTYNRLPWSQSIVQAIGRVGRTRATANHTAAAIAGARAFLAVLAVGAVWIGSGWVDGATAIVAVAITSALFALAPNPTAASWQIFSGCLAGWLVGFAFNFLILPRIDTFGLLAASMAIVVMVGSYLNTFAKTAIFGLGFSLYFCFIVNITNPTVYNPSTYLDTGFALLCGIAVAAIAFSVLMPQAGDWISAQYMRQIRRLISQDACDGDLDDLLYKFELNLRDFILQIASAPTDPRVDRHHLIGWAFAALEIGRSMIWMRVDTEQLGAILPPDWPVVQAAWLAALAQLFSTATPQSAKQALVATRRALDMLPLGANIAVDAIALTQYRMRALLHFTELTLRDDSLSLWQFDGVQA